MAGLGAAVKAEAKRLRDALAGAGVPTDLDPGSVPVPGAWVQIRSLTPISIDEGYTVRFHVHLVVPDAGALEAWDGLAELLDAALTVVDPDEPINTATALTLPHTPSQPLPALLLVVDSNIDVDED